MEGKADDVVKAAIYNYDGRDYMVISELVYQSTSKESGRGRTIITGFKEQRLSAILTSRTILPLFFDPGDANETNAFREVFSKGNPDFSFS